MSKARTWNGVRSALAVGLVLAMAGAAQGAFVAGQFGPGGTWNVYEWVNTSTTWDQARVNAAASSVLATPGHLVVIGSAGENTFVNGFGTGSRWIGLTDATAVSTLDAFNPAVSLGTAEFGNTSGAAYPPAGQTPSNTPGTQRGEGWAWVTGQPLVYHNWNNPNEPNDSGGENAGVLYTTGVWNDWNAGLSIADGPNSTTTSLVEYETNSLQQPGLPGSGSLDPVTGHYYERVMDTRTWDEARVDAKFRKFGGVIGHLATIGDAGENEVVRNIGGTGNKWIGFTDSDQTSTLDGTTMGGTEFGNTSGNPYPPGGNRGAGWVWGTGEAVTFQNWGTNEPNDAGGNEDAAFVRTDGFWNDHRTGSTLGQAPDFSLTSVVEYDTTPSRYPLNYRERRAAGTFMGDGQVNDLADARALMRLPSGHADIAAEAIANVFAISFQDPDLGGGQGAWIRRPFLTDTPGTDDNDFAVEATGMVLIPGAGAWTFAITHDDYFVLTVGPNTHTQLSSGNPTLMNFTFPAAGNYALSLLWQERSGGAYLQLFAAQGNVAWDPNVFELVGDTYNGGLELMSPEPGTMTLLAFGGIGALLRRRRRRKTA